MSPGQGPFRVEFQRQAAREMEDLPPDKGRAILRAMDAYLSDRPFTEVKTRIKRLAGFSPPLYRLRVGDYRVYYRIIERRVAVLAVLHKKDSERWLRRRP